MLDLKGKKLRLCVLFGGKSGEHEVSLMSATNVINAIDKEKFDIIMVGINKEGKFAEYNGPVEEIINGNWENYVEAFSNIFPEDCNKIDVAFPVLHGPFGEDGKIQGMLEWLGIPYVGSDVISSAIGMDKDIAKRLFIYGGLNTGSYITATKKEILDDIDNVLSIISTSLYFPIFIKPVNMGSSVGITKAHNLEEARTGLINAIKYDRKIIIEEGIDCRELEVSVLGNDEPITSEVGEILPSHEFYDYESKYFDGDNSALLIPAPLEEKISDKIKKAAIVAYKAIGASGMARVDFFLNKKNGDILINEINTIPGFTRISMYPKLWNASGMSYPEIIERLIELAIERDKYS